MAAPTFLNGPTTDGFVGNVCQGGFNPNVYEGRAQFVGTAQTCTLPARGSGVSSIRLVLLSAGTAGLAGMTYTANSDGTVTVVRTDTTSNAEFSYHVKYG